MLNPSDVYTEGGNSDLLVCWTDKVTKYDASSFYNWEMDNLPLHDLDERTHLLWERVGHPTSSITGMSFIVSGDLVSEGCSPHYFKSLSSCMAALPDVINYPILVEVVSFGQLGSLEIPAKTFGPRGKLEIINRNSSFAGAIGLSGGPMSIQETGQENFCPSIYLGQKHLMVITMWPLEVDRGKMLGSDMMIMEVMSSPEEYTLMGIID